MGRPLEVTEMQYLRILATIQLSVVCVHVVDYRRPGQENKIVLCACECACE